MSAANSPVGVPDPAEAEALAEWLGAMDEARNVFDLTDEATTVISIDVDVLAERIAARAVSKRAHQHTGTGGE